MTSFAPDVEPLTGSAWPRTAGTLGADVACTGGGAGRGVLLTTAFAGRAGWPLVLGADAEPTALVVVDGRGTVEAVVLDASVVAAGVHGT